MTERKNPFDKKSTKKANEETATLPNVDAGELGEMDDNLDDKQLNIENPFLPTSAEKYTKEDILPLMDALLMNGYATTTFNIRKAKVTLRTRFTWEEQAIYKHMENENLKTALAYQREFAIVYIAASLVQFGDYIFEPINAGKPDELKNSLDERIEFIQSLNTVMTDLLQHKLYDFDDKQKYLIDNFDKLMQDF